MNCDYKTDLLMVWEIQRAVITELWWRGGDEIQCRSLDTAVCRLASPFRFDCRQLASAWENTFSKRSEKIDFMWRETFRISAEKTWFLIKT